MRSSDVGEIITFSLKKVHFCRRLFAFPFEEHYQDSHQIVFSLKLSNLESSHHVVHPSYVCKTEGGNPINVI